MSDARPGPELHDALLALRRMRDPRRRVAAATTLLEQLGEVEREVSALRDDAIRRLRAEGHSYGGIASVSGLTRSRIAQLLHRGRPDASPDPAAP